MVFSMLAMITTSTGRLVEILKVSRPSFSTAALDPVVRQVCAAIDWLYRGVAPLITAWELAQAWPNSELVIVNNAGHDIFTE